MKLLFLSQNAENSSTRYRLLQYIPYLQSRGVSVKVKDIPRDYKGRMKLYSTIGADETVILQKMLLPFWDLRLLVKNAGRLIYDFDDSVMLPNSFARKKHSLTRKKRFERIVRKADTIITGNVYLKEKVEALGKRAVVIPTSVDTEACFPGARVETGKTTLGWIGSGSTLPYLKGLIPTLEKSAAANPQLRLKVVCDRPLEAARMDMENKRWSLDEEVEDLRSFHIGLMPLLDDPWAHGKCGFKLLLYMAVGIPAVASPVGVNRQIIQDGVNGFLAGNNEEWVDKINILTADAELRESMGARARQTVEGRYSLIVNAPVFLDTVSNHDMVGQ